MDEHDPAEVKPQRSDDQALRVVAGPDLTPRQLHDLLRLRVQVFVVEQGDPYQAIDGVDLDPGTRHLWIEDEAGVVESAIRLVREPCPNHDDPDPDERLHRWRIGAVITAEAARGRGLAARLINQALVLTERDDAELGLDVVLHAQAHLAGWYSRFGFEVEGEEHLDGRIPHLWMRRRR
ncbi:GNAT family N-acetyltransferase [Aestuariimicrobium sp. T2.26MG-19.2B]|uniref:GNAT family N-acetyltransferase n=1 Tax=Aestuariimicrobium sp. T2.26MG-19.2B TaxID=3040679 RepID=UPI0024777952|nr:GNAT family N-acetyltransferase [Aestuariimicrobium sp. T2.26MG-19.2B]CAI9409492.1 hypothetical protein AESSP_02245 [Aestuariimicrobium sp. T2.26MG-19.2B]